MNIYSNCTIRMRVLHYFDDSITSTRTLLMNVTKKRWSGERKKDCRRYLQSKTSFRKSMHHPVSCCALFVSRTQKCFYGPQSFKPLPIHFVGLPWNLSMSAKGLEIFLKVLKRRKSLAIGGTDPLHPGLSYANLLDHSDYKAACCIGFFLSVLLHRIE